VISTRMKMGSNHHVLLLRWLLVCAFLLALLVSCTAEPESPDASSTLAAQPPAPESSPTVEIRNGPSPGWLKIKPNGDIDLASELIVEQLLDDGSFKPLQNLDGGSMKLVTACGQNVGGCVRIDKCGIQPVRWSGMSCSAQCNYACKKDSVLRGKFRFVVTSCDGTRRFEGSVFDYETPDILIDRF